MRVEAIMQRAVVTVRPETTLRDVARILTEHAISGVPVADEAGAVLGVVSEADFVTREGGLADDRRRGLFHLLAEGPDRAAMLKVEARTAGEAMTSPAITVEPVASIRDAARIMTERQVNRLPVVHDGRLVGILTRADLVRAYARSDEELTAAVREDVIRRAMWLDEAAVTVRVVDGVATLTGVVEKRSDVPILERLVREVPGVLGCEMAVDWTLDDSGIEPEVRDLVNPPFGPA
jgi:CBS domain-containing protein